MKKPLLLLYFILAFEIGACLPSKDYVFDNNTEHDDYLVYLMCGQGLMMYNPVNDIHTPILPDWKIDKFTLSINFRLAFTSSQDGDNKLYVLDFPFLENFPVEIDLNPGTEIKPISWSPDEQYLLIDTVQTYEKKLLIWDGKDVFDIYSYHEQVSEIAWSSTGQLAFTDFYAFVFPNDEEDHSEIFIWDGNITVSASQNPSGVDRHPTWNNDGQLAFLSERNGEYDIFIWDGITKVNGVPDPKTFSNIAPDMTDYYSHPTWTNTNSIAFEAQSETDFNAQIYEWDGQTTRNISKNPFAHNGGQAWRSDGYWAFITFFSATQDLYIRDETNRTVLKTKGQYQPTWSQNGLLMFCVPNSPDWTLSMWDGNEVIEIIHGSWIEAKWNNGEAVFCSNG